MAAPSCRAAVPAAGAALVAAAFVVSATLPFATYVWTLTLFGVAHVALELRYVDERFGARLGRPVAIATGLLLAAVVGHRAAALLGVGLAAPHAVEATLLAVAPLAVALPLARRRPVGALALLAVGAALGAAAVVAPLETVVLFAVAHNLTPVGFLAERLTGTGRRTALGLAALAFGLLPAVLASGVWRSALPSAGSLATGLGSAGEPLGHLGVFVPTAWLGDGAVALDVFRAAVFLQCMHYAAVLGVLPRLGGGDFAARSLVVWPRRIGGWVALAGAGFALHFVVAFGEARAAYGVFAALHAWLEIPVLALAAIGGTSAAPELRR